VWPPKQPVNSQSFIKPSGLEKSRYFAIAPARPACLARVGWPAGATWLMPVRTRATGLDRWGRFVCRLDACGCEKTEFRSSGRGHCIRIPALRPSHA
jgi:hypothetical protein